MISKLITSDKLVLTFMSVNETLKRGCQMKITEDYFRSSGSVQYVSYDKKSENPQK